MNIEFHCNKCGQLIIVDETAAGLQAECPSCGQFVVVPRPQQPMVAVPSGQHAPAAAASGRVSVKKLRTTRGEKALFTFTRVFALVLSVLLLVGIVLTAVGLVLVQRRSTLVSYSEVKEQLNPKQRPDFFPVWQGTQPEIEMPANVKKYFGPWLFSADDFRDLSTLAARLRARSDGVSQFIWDLLSAETKQTLANPDPWMMMRGDGRSVLIESFNRILRGGPIFDPNRFATVPLSQQTRDFLQRKPTGEDLVRLNRMLLEDAFPQEIARHQEKRTQISAWLEGLSSDQKREFLFNLSRIIGDAESESGNIYFSATAYAMLKRSKLEASERDRITVIETRTMMVQAILSMMVLLALLSLILVLLAIERNTRSDTS